MYSSISHTLPIPSGRPQVCLHALITLDGYVADPTLEHTAEQWQRLDIEQCSQYMLARSDALILGRSTYEAIIEHSEWPYLDHQAHVLTSREGLILNSSFLKICHDPLDQLLQHLNQQQVSRVWLMGGHRLVIGALALGVIDELVIHMLPFAQGQGQSFFDAPDLPDFNLLDVQRLNGGVARMHYQVS
jgi:dihydrofolate reductase